MKGPLNYCSYVNVTMKPSFSWYLDVSVAVKLRTLTKLRFALLSVAPLIIRVKLYTWWALFLVTMATFLQLRKYYQWPWISTRFSRHLDKRYRGNFLNWRNINQKTLTSIIYRKISAFDCRLYLNFSFFIRRENSVHMMMLRVDKKSLLGINFLFSKEITWFISSRNHMHSNTG